MYLKCDVYLKLNFKCNLILANLLYMAKHNHLENFKAVYQSFALPNLLLKKFDYQFQTEPCSDNAWQSRWQLGYHRWMNIE